MDRQFLKLVMFLSLLTFGGVWLWTARDLPGTPIALAWSGCRAFKALGKAPIYREDPNYRSDLDADGDGVACE